MLQVELFQAHQLLYQGRAHQVILPGEDGELSLLECHAPMLCALMPGIVQVDERRFRIDGGIARVFRNALIVVGM